MGEHVNTNAIFYYVTIVEVETSIALTPLIKCV